MWRSLQKWHAWLLSPLELPYCSQSKINSFNLSKAHIYKIETSGNPYSGLKRPSQSFRIQKHPKCSGVARGGVQWEVLWYPQWRSEVVKLLYRDEWVLKVWGSLCFINAVMNSHTTVWWNTKLETEDATSPHSLHYGHFFSMTMKIFILPRWKSFSDIYFTQS